MCLFLFRPTLLLYGVNKDILVNLFKLLSIILVLNLLAACGNTSRYSQTHDSIPTRLPTSSELVEPAPKVESPSRGGNKPYQVFGKNYKVMNSAQGYVAEGVASWYGNKFHGHLTSNGETYDMYAFSAAHKSLPLPTYLQVTNLANNKSVIVRVNDRGPFHQDRLIDLSYSAAYKLGYLAQGTAKVKIEAITAANLAKFSPQLIKKNQIAKTPKPTPSVQKPQTSLPASSAKFAQFIHVLVTRDKMLADNTAKGLKFLLQVPIKLTETNELYRVQIGPIANAKQAKLLLANIQKQGYPEAYSLNSFK